MNYKDINFNEVLISGIINSITNINDQYVKFNITANKHINGIYYDVYVNLDISKELYDIYLDCFNKGNKVYVRGYLNSYFDKNNMIKSLITVTSICDNPDEIIKKGPHIRYDTDGVMEW